MCVNDVVSILCALINDITIDSYEKLVNILSTVENSKRIHIYVLLHKNNKLDNLVVNTDTFEQFIKKNFNIDCMEENKTETLIDVDFDSSDSCVCRPNFVIIFNKLLSDKIIKCENCVQFAIYSEMYKMSIIELLLSIKGNMEITESDKRLSVMSAKKFIADLIKKFGTRYIFNIFDKIFCSAEEFEKIWVAFTCNSDSHKLREHIEHIQFDNKTLWVLGIKSHMDSIKEKNSENIYSYFSLVKDMCFYEIYITKKSKTDIQIKIKLSTTDGISCLKFDKTLTITRGLLITFDDINDNTNNKKTYYLK